MSVRCEHCGVLNATGNNFCIHCGTQIQNTCPQCHYNNDRGSRFCAYCGYKLVFECAYCHFPNLLHQKFCGSCHRQLTLEQEVQPDRGPARQSIAQPVANQPEPQTSRYAEPAALDYGEVISDASPVPVKPKADLGPSVPVLSQPRLVTPTDAIANLLLDKPPAPQPVTAPSVESFPAMPQQVMAQPKPQPQPQAFEPEPEPEKPEPVAPEPASPSSLETHAGLPRFAIVSLEFPEPDDPAERSVLLYQMRDAIAWIDQQAAPLNGILEAATRTTMFIAFPHSATIEDSALDAVRFAFNVHKHKFEPGHQPLSVKPKIGIDLDSKSRRNPLAATLERSLATSGSVVVSQDVYQIVHEQFAAKPIGPLQVGQQSIVCYQILDMKSSAAATRETFEATPPSPAHTETEFAGLLQSEPRQHSAQPVASMPDEPDDGFEEDESPYEARKPSSMSSQTQRQPTSVQSMPFDSESQSFGDFLTPVPQQPLATDPPERFEPPAPDESGYEEAAVQQPQSVGQSAAEESPEESFDPRTYAYHYPRLFVPTAAPSTTHTYETAVQDLTGLLNDLMNSGSRKGSLIRLMAPDGLGKSNILQMSRGMTDPETQRSFWLGAISYRYFADDLFPLAYWLEVFQNFFGLPPESYPAEEAKVVIDRVLQHMFPDGVPAGITEVLLDVVLINPLKALNPSIMDAMDWLENFIYTFVEALARQKPVIIIAEDWHLMDTASLRILCRLINRGLLTDLPVHILATQVPDAIEVGPLARVIRKIDSHALTIAPLSIDECRKFLNDGPLAGHLQEFPEHLIQQCVMNAAGLPLYIEESLRLLHLQGFITIEEGTGKFLPVKPDKKKSKDFQKNIEAVVLPFSLNEVSRERMAFLSDTARNMLMLAAWLGERFSLSTLGQLCKMEPEPFNATLKELWDHGWIIPEVANCGRFRHTLLWQGVYSFPEQSIRQQGHQLICEYLESLMNAQSPVHPASIAIHATMGDLSNKAFNYWNLAGVYGANLGSVPALNIAMFRALSLMATGRVVPENTLMTRLHMTLAQFNTSYQPSMAYALVKPVLESAIVSGDLPQIADLGDLAVSTLEQMGKYHEALELLERILSPVNMNAIPEAFFPLLNAKMEFLFLLGRVSEGRYLLENVLQPHFNSLSDKGDPDSLLPGLQLNLMLYQARARLSHCDKSAFELIEQHLQRAQQLDMDHQVVAGKLVRCQGFIMMGRYDSAQRSLQTILDEIEAVGRNDTMLAHWGMLSLICNTDLGDWQTVSVLIDRCLTQADIARDYLAQAMMHVLAGRLALGLGRLSDAQTMLEEAIQFSSSYRFAAPSLMGWRYLAELALDTQAYDVAENVAASALAIARKDEIGNLYEAYLLNALHARCLLALGRIKEAGKSLEHQWSQVAKTGFSPVIAQTAFAIGELYHAIAVQAGKGETGKAVEFFERAKQIWKESENAYEADRVHQRMAQLGYGPPKPPNAFSI